MQPTGELHGDAVHVGGDARQRFYDSRGYGRPLAGNEIALSRVEAAHLLFRGDLSAVTLQGADDAPGDGRNGADGRNGIGGDRGGTVGFERFFVESAAAVDRFAVRYLVFADLRDRGFYLSPARGGWPGGKHATADAIDLVVYERGSTPDTGEVRHPVQVVGELESISASGLAGRTLAVVDEESDITYFTAREAEIAGSTTYEPPMDLSGVLLDDRVVVWDAPEDIYERGFYGRPLTGRAAEIEGALQLSLVEAASLAARGTLSLSRAVGDEAIGEGDASHGDPVDAMAAIVARGREVEGERYDRRLAVYERLRDRETVPKTGFKFGADFRTYLDVRTVEDLPHSEHLVRVVEPDHVFSPRELSLDVRLAGGVRKEMVFALADEHDRTRENDGIEWLSVGRLTP